MVFFVYHGSALPTKSGLLPDQIRCATRKNPACHPTRSAVCHLALRVTAPRFRLRISEVSARFRSFAF
eukprot:6122640-Prymnesium_polylepis.1